MKWKDILFTGILFIIIILYLTEIYWANKEWDVYVFIVNTILSALLFVMGVFDKLKGDSSLGYRWSVYTIIAGFSTYFSLIRLCNVLLP
jgi:hypothetical protein